MGIEKSLKKLKKRERFELNKMQGLIAEGTYVITQREQFSSVKRAPIGSDYVVQRINPLTGRKGPKTLVEIKSGGAKLSKLQKKTRKKSKRYEVVRF